MYKNAKQGCGGQRWELQKYQRSDDIKFVA
jgi:hypothetical protein